MTPGSPPYHPALPGRNATTTVRGAGAGLPPDLVSPSCDHLFVLYPLTQSSGR